MIAVYKCPVCIGPEDIERVQDGDAIKVDCPCCGRYRMTESALPRAEQMPVEARPALSHFIRRSGRRNEWPKVTHDLVKEVEQNPELPEPIEQLDLLIIHIGDRQKSPGQQMIVRCSVDYAAIGSFDPQSALFIVSEAESIGLISARKSLDGSAMCALTLKGWQRHAELKRGIGASQTAFIAMKFGDANLDMMLADCFKPAVQQTGFRLLRLDDEPKAGLIDDRLRVEIRRARFLLADLTHKNNGAYWEAGYAEGLGKPVIYLFEKSKFSPSDSHFDTNHHTHVLWDPSDLSGTAEQLKATIRFSMPDARQSDLQT